MIPRRVTDTDELEAFLAERNKALIEMDLDYARRVIPLAKEDAVLVLALHKARYECTGIPAAYRQESRAWLAERGYRRMSGDELLPEGELPE